MGDDVPPLEFLDSEIQREEKEFDDQIPYAPEDIESPPEELLEVPPSKRRHAWYRETVQEDEKHKAPPETFRENIRTREHKYFPWGNHKGENPAKLLQYRTQP